MSLERAWLLLFAPIPLAWAAYQWRRGSRGWPAALKALSILCVALALAGPRMRFSTTRTAVAVLVDTSESVGDADLARASRLASAIEASRGRNWVRVIPFAGESGAAGSLRRMSGETALTTDIEAALKDALSSIPSGLVPRVALISDGKENRGSAARAAMLFRQAGAPIDAFPLAGRPKPELTLESVTLPGAVFVGEQFAIDMEVRSPRRMECVVEIAADDKLLASTPVDIEAGTRPLRVYARVNEPGVIGLTVTIRNQGEEAARFGRALRLVRPRLLFVSADPPGSEIHLLAAWRAAGFEIEQTDDAAQPKLEDYQLTVLNNWDIELLPQSRKQEIENYVKAGGGLLIVGGEKNLYPERDRTEEDPLDRVLPAKISPPRAPEIRCVVLVIDKSASMTQAGKIDLARLAALGVIENLRPTDMIGVIIFDYEFRWLIPIGPVEDKNQLERLVSGIVPSGGTQIAPALADAYDKIAPVRAAYKHIVLLTDGIAETGDSYAVAQQAGARNISISTIGLGSSVNKTLLSNIGVYSNGSSYFLDDPTNLEQVLLHDVREHTQTTTVEKAVSASALGRVELLDGLRMEDAPPLAGYVRYTAKPAAQTILEVDDRQPLLTRWQYGLGRAMVFASDAKSRWASQWVSWGGFDKFWSNIARDLLPRAQAGEATMEYDSANGELALDYKLASGAEAPTRVPEIFAFGPGGFERLVEVKKVSERAYRGRLRVDDPRGLYRARPLADSRAFPETGVYVETDEMREYGNDEPLLRGLAETTGGRFNPPPGAVFDAGTRSASAMVPLWPFLLGAAILLNLAELSVRKWGGVLETLRRR